MTLLIVSPGDDKVLFSFYRPQPDMSVLGDNAHLFA